MTLVSDDHLLTDFTADDGPSNLGVPVSASTDDPAEPAVAGTVHVGSATNAHPQEEYRMKIVTLVAILVSLAPSLGRADDSLVRFKGGIGVDGVSSGVGTDATATTVNLNIVRAGQPAGSP